MTEFLNKIIQKHSSGQLEMDFSGEDLKRAPKVLCQKIPQKEKNIPANYA